MRKLVELNNALLSLSDTITMRMGDYPPMSSLLLSQTISVRIAEIFNLQAGGTIPAERAEYDPVYDALVEATHMVVAAGYAGQPDFDGALTKARTAVTAFRQLLP